MNSFKKRQAYEVDIGTAIDAWEEMVIGDARSIHAYISKINDAARISLLMLQLFLPIY